MDLINKERIEKDAKDHACSYSYSYASVRGFISGSIAEHEHMTELLKRERNNTVDEALRILINYTGAFDIKENYNSLKYQIESLKFKSE